MINIKINVHDPVSAYHIKDQCPFACLCLPYNYTVIEQGWWTIRRVLSTACQADTESGTYNPVYQLWVNFLFFFVETNFIYLLVYWIICWFNYLFTHILFILRGR